VTPCRGAIARCAPGGFSKIIETKQLTHLIRFNLLTWVKLVSCNYPHLLLRRMQKMLSLNRWKKTGAVAPSVLLPCLGLAAGVLWVGCGQNNPTPTQHTDAGAERGAAQASSVQPTYTFSDFPVPAKPGDERTLIERGKIIYGQNCASCHGGKGDGNGVCSAFLLPHPRDFTKAHYRFRSTPLGHLPTDADLFRIVSLGVKGTPMPPWKWLLDETDRWAAVEYVKTFSPRFSDTNEDRTSLINLGEPVARSDAALAEGKALYTKLACITCHGEQGLGNGSSAASLMDDSGHHISPRDFSKPSGFKAGYSTREIVRTFMSGLDGTPMPGFANSISTEDAWKLAYYVQSLARPSVVPLARVSQGFANQEKLGNPDVRVKLLERAWKYDPQEIHVKKGQIVEILFQPTDNGLGAGHGFAISSYDEVAFINGAMVGAPKTVKFRADRAGRFTFYCATQCSTDKLHPLMNGTLYVEDPSGQRAAVQ
jgi:mono/diheme cytochrome c family protein